MMVRKFSLLAMLSAMALMTGCGSRGEVGPAQGVIVKVTEVGGASRGGDLTYPGTVHSSKSSTLTAPIPGTVSKVAVRKGDKVEKGQVLVTIDSENARSSLEIARASLRQARDGYSRVMKLYEKDLVAEVKKIEIETQLRQAEAAERAARKAVENCTVKAPFSGIVDDVLVEQGVEIGPLSPVVRIVDADNVELRFNVPEAEIGDIAIGDTYDVEIPALGKGMKATVTAKGAAGNALAHSYECAATPDSPVEGLQPGMVVKARRKLQSTHALCIPAGAIFTDMAGRYVYIVKNGVVEKRFVECSGYSADGIIVSKGVSEGDLVVVEGARKICSGMNVGVMR